MSIDANGRSHAPAGISTGGRFETAPHTEPDVHLAEAQGGLHTLGPLGGHWVCLQREHHHNLALGPFATAEAAVLAMNESSLVQGLCEEDCTDCWSVPAADQGGLWEVAVVDEMFDEDGNELDVAEA